MLLHISCDIASGLEYLHARGIIHRHIAFANILLSVCRNTDSLSAKLGGQFASRVSCRVRHEVAVVGGDSELSVEIAGQAGCPPLTDARPVDILALGHLLLRLWQQLPVEAFPPKRQPSKPRSP